MNGDGIERELGGLQARVVTLETTVRELHMDVKQILGIATATKLGWKVLLSVAAIAGMLGALMSNAAVWLSVLPK